MSSSKRKGQIDPSPPVAISSSESDGLDFFSLLPDCLLYSIVSLLPIKDSARTSVLSSRWRHLWKAVPLCLDVDDYSLRREDYSRIFSFHYGPVDSLCLTLFPDAAFYPEVDRILESAVQRGIRQLTLHFQFGFGTFDLVSYQLLPSLLHSESLQQLSIQKCRFPEPVLPPIFPNLKELRLDFVEPSTDFIQMLVSNCFSLETLHLSCFEVPSVVSISLPRLRKLVWKSWQTEGLIIENTPNLQSLILAQNTKISKVMVWYAPKLELLGFISMAFDVLQLGETCFKPQEPQGYGSMLIDVKATPCRMKTLCTVRTLAIAMWYSQLDRILPSLLRCFPCLENLNVLNYDIGYHGGYPLPKGFWEEQDSSSFLDHLKTVTVKGFYGDQTEVEFLRYLVVHGTVLKKITLLCSKDIRKKFVETKRRQLCMNKRASSDLELFFFKDTGFDDYLSVWNEFIDAHN